MLADDLHGAAEDLLLPQLLPQLIIVAAARVGDVFELLSGNCASSVARHFPPLKRANDARFQISAEAPARRIVNKPRAGLEEPADDILHHLVGQLTIRAVAICVT